MASSSSATTSEKRLYIGNLSPSVDEYSLMQICAKYGKIAKLDYLFHKTGPQKGKPRGYAFVEYATKEEALRAKTTLHDKVLRGRKLIVSLASEQDPAQSTAMLAGGKKRRTGGPVSSEPNRPTAISLLKGQGVAHAPTNRKIAALEAKLALMQQKKDATPTESRPASSTSTERGADEFLNDLLTPSSASTDQTLDPVPLSAGRLPIDTLKAGLPARPSFESTEPPRKL
ncbi:RNA binding motif protein 18 [Sporobolomyces koalae]|uniref:RNA binding motif protein 18 n=1 Tax=Sporobolomyces koalae TaxID=500713 RepID=UPI0031812600